MEVSIQVSIFIFIINLILDILNSHARDEEFRVDFTVTAMSFNVVADRAQSTLSTSVKFVSDKDQSVLFNFSATGNYVFNGLITKDAANQFYYNLNLALADNVRPVLNIPSKYEGVDIVGLNSLFLNNLRGYLAENPYNLFKDGTGVSINKSFIHYLGSMFIPGQGILVIGDNNNSPVDFEIVEEEKEYKNLRTLS